MSEEIEFPFDKTNTAYVPVLVPLVRRAASQGLSDPWVVAPIEDLLHHANINQQDSQYKLTLLSLRDSGIKFLIVPPSDASLDNALGESFSVGERIEADHDSIL